MKYNRRIHIFLACILIAVFSLQNIIPVKAEEGVTLEEKLNKIVSYYNNKTKLDNWEEVVGLSRAGQDLSRWELPDWGIDSLDDSSDASAYASAILGMLAAGQDPTNVGGRNLVEELKAKQAEDGGFGGTINQTLWSMIALDTAGADYSVEDAVYYVLGKQKANGGFALSGDNADPDVTGLALMALSTYKDAENVSDAVYRAVCCLKDIQLDSGGFGWQSDEGVVENAESTASVIRGLVAIGEDITSGEWKKNDSTMIDALFAFQLEDGSFAHTLGGGSNAMATRQALIAAADLVNAGLESYIVKTPSLPPASQPGENATVRVRVEGHTASLADKVVIVSGTALDALKAAVGADNVDETGGFITGIMGETGNPNLAENVGSYWSYYVIRDGAVDPAAFSSGSNAYDVKDGDQVIFYINAYDTITWAGKTYLPVVSVIPQNPKAGDALTITIEAKKYDWFAGSFMDLTQEEIEAIGEYTVTVGEVEYVTQSGQVTIPDVPEGTLSFTITNGNPAGYPDVVTYKGSVNVAPPPAPKIPVSIRVNIAVVGEDDDILFGPGRVTISEDDEFGLTAMGALDATGLDWEFSDKWEGFIVRIEGYENHGLSGWMYKVNGRVPGVQATEKRLNQGDEVIWWYSTDPDSDGPTWDDLTELKSMAENDPSKLASDKLDDIKSGLDSGKLKPEDAIKKINDLMKNEITKLLKSGETDVDKAADIMMEVFKNAVWPLVKNEVATAMHAVKALKSAVDYGLVVVFDMDDADDVKDKLKNEVAAAARDILAKTCRVPASQLRMTASGDGATIELSPETVESRLEEAKDIRDELFDILSSAGLKDVAENIRQPLNEIVVSIPDDAAAQIIISAETAGALETAGIKLVVSCGNGLQVVLSESSLPYKTAFAQGKTYRAASRPSATNTGNNPGITGHLLTIVKLDSAEKEKLKQDAAAQSSGNLTLTPAGEAYRIDLKTVSGSDAVARQALPFEIRMSYEGLDGDAELLGIYRYEDGKFDFAGARHIKSEKIVNAMVNTGGTYTLLEYQKKFEDLSGHWAEDEIRRLSARHVVNGVGDSHFEPEGTATRAQCAAMLVRALGLPQVPPEEVKFGDVSAVSWYAGSVGAAVRSGIVKGTSDTTFSPDRSITRAELAVMASRILSDRTGKAAVDSGEILGEYQDAGKVPAWAQDGMAAAVDAGIVEGRGSGTLAPDAPVTRAEASAIILRLLEKLEQ